MGFLERLAEEAEEQMDDTINKESGKGKEVYSSDM